VPNAKNEIPEKGWRLFIEHSFNADAGEPLPDWIPYLPVPVKAKHAVYGDVAFTTERNAHMVDNFKSGVYQTRIPLDAEHQTKMSGAMAWITDMRTNADNSVDALVEWTDRGERMLKGGRYRYISPEFFPTWRDPVTDEVHNDVAIGGAMTVRPFLKEDYLRPLVATEKGIFAVDEERSDESTVVFLSIQESEEAMGDEVVVDKIEVPEVEVLQLDEPVLETQEQGYTELQHKFSELQSALAGEAEKRKEAEVQSQKLTEILDKSNQRIAAMEESALIKRFNEIVESGNRWFGETDLHVSIMRAFSESFGEDSDEFRNYVGQQEAFAQNIQKSELFKEIGHGRQNNDVTAEDELATKARELQVQRPELTDAQAYSEATLANPAIYDRHTKGE
jgi:hypothetical protein